MMTADDSHTTCNEIKFKFEIIIRIIYACNKYVLVYYVNVGDG